MRVLIIIVWMLVVTAATVRAASDADSTRSEPQSIAPLSQGLMLSRYTASERRDTPTPNYLTFSLSPFTVQPYVPQSTFDALMYGAGTGGALGMFVGAIGNTLGLFDEQTTWIITGAAAAAGAIYSGSRFNLQATLRPEPWSIPTGPPHSP
jgi:hypothetical protein